MHLEKAASTIAIVLAAGSAVLSYNTHRRQRLVEQATAAPVETIAARAERAARLAAANRQKLSRAELVVEGLEPRPGLGRSIRIENHGLATATLLRVEAMNCDPDAPGSAGRPMASPLPDDRQTIGPRERCDVKVVGVGEGPAYITLSWRDGRDGTQRDTVVIEMPPWPGRLTDPPFQETLGPPA